MLGGEPARVADRVPWAAEQSPANRELVVILIDAHSGEFVQGSAGG
jgi:hypothetical protein